MELQSILPFYSMYRRLMYRDSDLRTSNWFLIYSPWPVVVIVLLYLLTIWLGSKIMASRPAFNLRSVLVWYNFGLVVLSAYMCWEFVASTFLVKGFNLACQKVVYRDTPNAMRLANVCWWYFFSKVIELLDTIFFLLRKKNNQISFLHVYHHVTMVLLWWVGVRFLAGGESYFAALINSFVHVLMYTYYLLSAMGPHMQKYLWWKKYMTVIQLTQFVIIILHTCYAILQNCGYPNSFQYALVVYMASHILLFTNFYNNAYIPQAALAPGSEVRAGAEHHGNGRDQKSAAMKQD